MPVSDEQLGLALARLELRRRESLELALSGVEPLQRVSAALGAIIAEVDAMQLRAYPAPPDRHLLELGLIARDVQELTGLLQLLEPPEGSSALPAGHAP